MAYASERYSCRVLSFTYSKNQMSAIDRSNLNAYPNMSLRFPPLIYRILEAIDLRSDDPQYLLHHEP